MKQVDVSLTSSQPISLSKAAQALSSFVSSKTGASQAVLAYLKRASVSFDELSQFHGDLKSRKSDRSSHKKTRYQAPEIHEDLKDERESRVKDRPLSDVDEERGDFDEGRKNASRKGKREVSDETGIDGDEKKWKKTGTKDGLDDGNRKLCSTSTVDEEKKKTKKKKKIKSSKIQVV